MNTHKNAYPGFAFDASVLSAYILTLDTFIISLKNGEVINYVPDDADKFEHWLLENEVRNIKN